MNAPRPLLPCPWCAEPAPALYDHDGDEICGACLDRALATDEPAHDDDEMPDYAPDAWRRF